MKKYIIILCCLYSFIHAEEIDIQQWEAFVDTRAVAFSSNGKYMAVAHENNAISVRDASGRIQIALLKGHFHSINTIAFSKDGSSLASGGQDLLVKIWSVQSGTDILTLSGHKAPITCLAFSSNKKLIATGSKDKTVKIWSVSTGTLLKTLTDFKTEISQVRFSEDSSIFIAKQLNNKVTLWKVTIADSSNVATEVKNSYYYVLQSKKERENGNLDKAVKLLETSISMDQKQIDAYYLLACAYSVRSQKYDNHTPASIQNKNIDLKKSTNSLKIAVQNGFKDWERLQTENDLDMIRTEDEYAQIADRFIKEKNQETSEDRRISFFVKNQNGNPASAYNIEVNKKVITPEDTFEVNKVYNLVIKFKEYETLKTQIRLIPGVGPYVISAPLRKLGKYSFSIRGTHLDIDGVRYDYEILIDGKPVPNHQIEKKEKQVLTYYTFYAEYNAKTIQVVAGYQLVEKRLFQIKDKGIRRLDQISAPLFIKHLKDLSSRGSGPVDAIKAFEKLLKSIYWRKILKKLSVDDLLMIFDDVEKWQLFNDSHQLRQRFLLDAINELISSK